MTNATPTKGTGKKLGANKAPNQGRGRPKGVPNKMTAQLKDMILGALNDAGGQAYLLERANDPKTQAAFLALIGKVLPVTLAGDPTQPVVVQLVRFGDAAH